MKPGAPNDNTGRDAPHIGQDQQYGREAAPTAQDKAVARETSSGQDQACNIRALCRLLRRALQNRQTALPTAALVRDPGAGLHGLLARV